ncbi:unnamed protein product [Rhizoctonia solani]|uniref:Helicase ATP-binding domain-containing protein n=1 Tax=Rhizoctonia solani TaxID=456999 RepID=A0A8H3B5Y1_9AGAM|nr:unnamed protein product [Rhizoctonia solani]
MNYEVEEDILSRDEIKELARQGLYPGEQREPSPTHPESPIEYPELELTDEDLTRIDEIDNSDIGAINTTPAPVPSLPSPPIIGPLTYTEALRVATKRATGFYPRAWQIALAWALYHGTCDALVVAGTGYGKTLPFILNLFLDSALLVWIVSPLNYIEMEQAKVFTNWGLRAIAVNSMTMRPGLIKDIESGKFQVVISSIESMMASNKLRPTLGSRKLAKRRQLLVLDEAHCVSSWAEAGFRPLYATVGNLRCLLPVGTPALATTATANNEVHASIQKVLAFRPGPYIANLGNFCSNLIHMVHHLKGAAGAVKEILHYFPSKTDLPVSLIFVNSRTMGQLVHQTLWEYIDPSPTLLEKPSDAGGLVSTREDQLAMKEEEIEFQEVEEETNATELDGPNGDVGGAIVDQEVDQELFGNVNHLPGSLNSKFNQKEQRMTYTKSILGYVWTSGYRNAFLDKEYNNPEQHTTCTTCDNCLGLSPVLADPNSGHAATDMKPDLTPDTKIIWLRPAEREDCEDRLKKWRQAKWASAECSDMDITVSYIMSDKILTSIAKHPSIESLSDLASTTLIWPFAEVWGNEIIDILQDEQRRCRFKTSTSMLKKFVRKIKSKQNTATIEWKAEVQAKVEPVDREEQVHTRHVEPSEEFISCTGCTNSSGTL